MLKTINRKQLKFLSENPSLILLQGLNLSDLYKTNSTKLDADKVVGNQSKISIKTIGDLSLNISDFFSNDAELKIQFFNSYKNDAFVIDIPNVTLSEEYKDKYVTSISKQYKAKVLDELYPSLLEEESAFKNVMKWRHFNKNSFIDTIIQETKTLCESDEIKKGWVEDFVKKLHVNTLDSFLKHS